MRPIHFLFRTDKIVDKNMHKTAVSMSLDNDHDSLPIYANNNTLHRATKQHDGQNSYITFSTIKTCCHVGDIENTIKAIDNFARTQQRL